jgi:hypothetical protein
MLSYRCEGDYSCWIINPTSYDILEGTVTNCKKELMKALENNVPVLLLSTQELKFMADADLGKKWLEMANLPPVFTHKNGKVIPIEK